MWIMYTVYLFYMDCYHCSEWLQINCKPEEGSIVHWCLQSQPSFLLKLCEVALEYSNCTWWNTLPWHAFISFISITIKRKHCVQIIAICTLFNLFASLVRKKSKTCSYLGSFCATACNSASQWLAAHDLHLHKPDQKGTKDKLELSMDIHGIIWYPNIYIYNIYIHLYTFIYIYHDIHIHGTEWCAFHGSFIAAENKPGPARWGMCLASVQRVA